MASPNYPRPSSTVQASGGSSLAPARGSSHQPQVYGYSAQSQVFVVPPPYRPTSNREYPMGTLSIRTGAGGDAEGRLAIGGDGGDVNYTERRPRTDLANLAAASRTGPIQGAFAGNAGRVGAPSTLNGLQREFHNVEIETGQGGGARSTETRGRG